MKSFIFLTLQALVKGQCDEGYEWTNGQCEDIDECENVTEDVDFSNFFSMGGSGGGVCTGKGFECKNTPGSYQCVCSAGYKLDMMTRKKCYDRNECKYNDGRGPCDHECKNTEGSFLCRCDSGYELDENNTSCNDIQECKVENGGCSHTCVEEQGSYHCECPEGYELGSNDATCVDVDECYNGSHGCSYACSNYDGGYQCSCKRGQKLDSDQKTCIDINECEEDLHNCDNEVADCINEVYPKTFSCKCHKGFYLLGRTCNDIDECDQDDPCGPQQTCTNTPGSYYCACREEGYQFNDRTGLCEDINECRLGTHDCSTDLRCKNTDGGFLCKPKKTTTTTTTSTTTTTTTTTTTSTTTSTTVIIVTTTVAEEFNLLEKPGLLAIIIGAFAIIIIGLLVCLIVYCCRKRNRNNENRNQYSPGQNSVKIFASQKHEDHESEKFITKNSGNANYYSNESPRQVQSNRYNEPDRQYIHNQINDESNVQQSYTPTQHQQPTQHATSYTSNDFANNNHYSAINEPFQQRSIQPHQPRNPASHPRYHQPAAHPYHSSSHSNPQGHHPPTQNYDYTSDNHSYQQNNASPYASSAGMDHHGPSIDPSPPRPVYFNELNSHIGKVSS